MSLENENTVRVSQDDLPILGFLPVWIYHSICRAAIPAEQIKKSTLIRTIEHITDRELRGVVGFFIGYLKFNLHKLFELHYLDLDQPDFSTLEKDLVAGIDLLQTSTIEQPAFEEYQQFLREFAMRSAENPFVKIELSEEQKKKLLSQACLVQRMLS